MLLHWLVFVMVWSQPFYLLGLFFWITIFLRNNFLENNFFWGKVFACFKHINMLIQANFFVSHKKANKKGWPRNKPVVNHYRWFVETLAPIASLYQLFKITVRYCNTEKSVCQEKFSYSSTFLNKLFLFLGGEGNDWLPVLIK